MAPMGGNESEFSKEGRLTDTAGGNSAADTENASSASQGTVGAGNLSSIPGGKSRGFGASPDTATEGWSEQLDHLKRGASDFVGKAGDVASDVAQRAQDIAAQATDDLGTTIRRYPLQSLLVGFGIGAAVGLLLPSRR